MIQEQQYINLLFNYLQNWDFEAVNNFIPEINKDFKKSLPLQYYIGYFYEKKGDIYAATKQFQYCIQLESKFTYPYFHLANYILQNNPNINELEKLLIPIFGKKTIHLPTSNVSNTKAVLNLNDQIQIVNMLGPSYMRLKLYKKAQWLYTKAIQLLDDYTPKRELNTIDYNRNKKTFLLALGESTLNEDHDKSFSYYMNGLSQDDLVEIDKNLFNGASLGLHYTHLSKENLIIQTQKLIRKANKIYKSAINPVEIQETSDKIILGIISPDLNKNAVGLFVKALFSHLDLNLFQLVVYYTNLNHDNFTKDFQNIVCANGGIWVDAGILDDQTLYTKMRNDKLDILIDLIGAGSMNKLNLISMKPAKTIINYLGYPGSGYIDGYTHRFVDNFTDPQTDDNFHESLHSEKLVRLPRFLNFTLFDRIRLPDIVTKKKSDNICIGIMNKRSKFNKVIIDKWEEILEKNDRVIFYFKKDETENITLNRLNKKFNNRIKELPFYENLEDYLDAFNQFDLCLDTFPYSGTTTTCTSLLMGVPLFTVYDPFNNGHVSNVSGSILKACKLDQFLCKDLNEYVSNVNNWINNPCLHLDKDKIRKLFIDNMTNGEEFGKDVSQALLKINVT